MWGRRPPDLPGGGTILGTGDPEPELTKGCHRYTVGQELFWKPLPSRGHRGKTLTLLGGQGVREGDSEAGQEGTLGAEG